jgi:hypothetical protein
MNVIPYQCRRNKECVAHTVQLWRRFICWFPAIGMGIVSAMWFIYVAHLWGALPTRFDGFVASIGYLMGGDVTLNLGRRADALSHAIILAPFAFGLPFIFIVWAIRAQQAEKMRVLESRV